MMGTLVERSHAKTTPQERQQYLQRSYETTSNSALSFEEKVLRVLEVGRERFDLNAGFFAPTGRAEDSFEILQAVSSHDRIRSGVSGDPTR